MVSRTEPVRVSDESPDGRGSPEGQSYLVTGSFILAVERRKETTVCTSKVGSMTTPMMVSSRRTRRIRQQWRRDDDGARVASVVFQNIVVPGRGHAFRGPALDPDAVGGSYVDGVEGRSESGISPRRISGAT